MSTYNGEKFVKEQIDSILSQEGVLVDLLIRDDGSKDSTLDILESYGDKIKIVSGENIGCRNSFFELVKLSGEFDYYAFADQDDVWDRDKLRIAIEAIKKYHDKPSLYSSNARLVDADLNFIKNEDDRPLMTLQSAFIKNYCTGCTAVFNQYLMDALKNKIPVNAVAHDWWVGLLVFVLDGVSVYDYYPHISYRQHGDNVSGAEIKWTTKIVNRFNKFLNGRYYRNRMADDLLKLYSNRIRNDTKRTLEKISNERFAMLFDSNFKTSSWIDSLLYKICVLLNKY